MERNLLLKPKALMGSQYLRGAHHPHCDRHHSHLIWIGSRPLCLGCTCMYTGIAIGIPLAFLIDWSGISFISWVILITVLLSPTLAQPHLQFKLYKIISRSMLGICISIYLISALFLIVPPLEATIFRISILIVFFMLHRLIRQYRNRYTPSPCDNCPLGYFPTCEWNLPRLLADNGDQELIDALSNAELKNLITL